MPCRVKKKKKMSDLNGLKKRTAVQSEISLVIISIFSVHRLFIFFFSKIVSKLQRNLILSWNEI